MKRPTRFLSATLIAATLFFTLNAAAASGDIDTTFAGALGIVPGGTISDFAIQSDGRIIVCGEIGLINGISRPVLARLNADGSLDTSFVPPLIVNGICHLNRGCAIKRENTDRRTVGVYKRSG